jgi:hypothetical protein
VVPPGAAQLANANDAARTFPPALIEVFIERFPANLQKRMVNEIHFIFNR